MIREQDLQEAIAECMGKRNPDANTCIKLAAFYTILNQLYPKQEQEQNVQSVIPAMSFAAEPKEPSEQFIQWEGDSDFAQEVSGRAVSHIMPIMDELMQTVQVLQPRLYDAVMRKLKDN